MNAFSYIETDKDIALVDYAKKNLVSDPCTWQEGILDHVFRYYNKNHKRVALDVGASYGFVSTGLAQIFEKVHSFEINTQVLYHLKKNVSSYDNIHVYDFGLSSKTQKLLARNEGSKSGMTSIDNSGKELVDLKALDELNIENIDFIKVDVEGHEKDFFEGAMKTISIFKPVILFETNCGRELYSEKNRQYIFNLLKELNYKFADCRHNDVLFLPPV